MSDPLARRGRSGRGRRLPLSAGAAGKGRALDRFFVDNGASSRPTASARRFHGIGRTHARRTGRDLRRFRRGEQAKQTLADYFDIHLDHAPKEGAELVLDPIVLVARSISGGRVNVVGLRLPEDEEQAVPLTRRQAFRRKLSDIWSSVAGSSRQCLLAAISSRIYCSLSRFWLEPHLQRLAAIQAGADQKLEVSQNTIEKTVRTAEPSKICRDTRHDLQRNEAGGQSIAG